MTPLFEVIQVLRRAALLTFTLNPFKWVAPLALALLVVACGPGTGGTGVGPVADPVSGVYANVADTNAVLTAVSKASSVSDVAAAGTRNPDQALTLSFTTTDGRVEGMCWEFRYENAATQANGETRLSGVYRTGPAGADLSAIAAEPATLVTRAAPGGLFVTLLDASGAMLLSLTPAERLPIGAAPQAKPNCLTIGQQSALPSSKPNPPSP